MANDRWHPFIALLPGLPFVGNFVGPRGSSANYRQRTIQSSTLNCAHHGEKPEAFCYQSSNSGRGKGELLGPKAYGALGVNRVMKGA